MTQTLLARHTTEVQSISGDIVERAEQHGIAALCLRFTRDILRRINHGRMPNA